VRPSPRQSLSTDLTVPNRRGIAPASNARHVETEDRLFFGFRHLFDSRSAAQTFDDRGFSHSRLPISTDYSWYRAGD